MLDAEAGGMRFVPGRKIIWAVDKGEPMPERGDWDVCSVSVEDLMTLQRVRDNLMSGSHSFDNITLDSLTEIQDKIKRERSTTFTLDQQDWGYIFGIMNDVVVTFRDIVASQGMHSLTVVCGTHFRSGKFRPMISGQFGDKLPYKLDAIGYLTQVLDESTGKTRRALIFHGQDVYETGDRMGGRLPDVVWDPTVAKLVELVSDK